MKLSQFKPGKLLTIALMTMACTGVSVIGIVIGTVTTNGDGTYTYSYVVENLSELFDIVAWSLEFDFLPDWNRADTSGGGDVAVPSPGQAMWIAKEGTPIVGKSAQDFISLSDSDVVGFNESSGTFSFTSEFAPGYARNFEFGRSGESAGGIVVAPVREEKSILSIHKAPSVISESGRTAFFLIRRVDHLDGIVEVTVRTEDIDAIAHQHYLPVVRQLRFHGEESEQRVAVQILDNNQTDGDRQFRLLLENPVFGAVLGSPAAMVVTIADDEDAGLKQIITPTKKDVDTPPGRYFEFDVSYTTSDNDSSLSGLDLRIHFDSQALTWESFHTVHAGGKQFESTASQPDIDDHDQDPFTDRFVTIEWDDAAQNWPGVPLPLLLSRLRFRVASDMTPETITVVRFSGGSPNLTHAVRAAPVIVRVIEGVSLDVDDNGRHDALTDGLLILRYLANIRGPDLTSAGVAHDCGRCAEDRIVSFLDAARQAGMLDVDGNNNADAVTDGLLILRGLFGFKGGALVMGDVVGDLCSRCTAEAIGEHLDEFL